MIVILENKYFLGFNLLNTSTKCFTTIGNEGNVLQEEWLKEDQPKAYKCVTAVSQFFKNYIISDLLNYEINIPFIDYFSHNILICLLPLDPILDLVTTQLSSKKLF